MPWNLQFSGATPPPRPSCIDACCARNVPTWVEMSCGISNPCIYQKPDNSDLFKGHWSACSWELMNWATVGGSSSGDIAQRWGLVQKCEDTLLKVYLLHWRIIYSSYLPLSVHQLLHYHYLQWELICLKNYSYS